MMVANFGEISGKNGGTELKRLRWYLDNRV